MEQEHGALKDATNYQSGETQDNELSPRREHKIPSLHDPEIASPRPIRERVTEWLNAYLPARDSHVVNETPNGLHSSTNMNDNDMRSVSPTLTGPDTDTDSASTASVVRTHYKRLHLQYNGIGFWTDPLPQHIADHIQSVLKAGRGGPTLTPQQMKEARHERFFLHLHGDPSVDDFCAKFIFPGLADADFGYDVGISVMRAEKMTKHLIPQDKRPLHPPKPDRLYGYQTFPYYGSRDIREFILQMDMVNEIISPHYPKIPYYQSPIEDSAYPFLVVECKPGGPANRYMMSTLQCFVGLSACLNAIRWLNRGLEKYNTAENLANGKPHPMTVEAVVYGITIDPAGATIFVAWLNEDAATGPNRSRSPVYCAKEVKYLGFSEPEQIEELRQYIRNILDWAKGHRRTAISNAMMAIIEGHEKDMETAANGN